jgi:hypothetical protein
MKNVKNGKIYYNIKIIAKKRGKISLSYVSLYSKD